MNYELWVPEAVRSPSLRGSLSLERRQRPDKQKHSEEVAVATGPPSPELSSVADQMQYKLRTPEGRAVYKRRKAVNRSLDRSRRREGFGDFCCADWGTWRRNGS